MHIALRDACQGQDGARLDVPGFIDPFAGAGGFTHGHERLNGAIERGQSCSVVARQGGGHG